MSTITVDTTIFNPLSVPAEALNVEGIHSLCEECILHLPGCSDLMVRKELQKKFREFCQKTGSLLTYNDGPVNYETPVLALARDDGEFYVFKEAYLDERLCTGNEATLSKECGAVYVTFALTPDDDDESGDPVNYEAKVVYSYVPYIGAETAPLWFINKHGSAIVEGVLFSLQLMPGKPWSDPVSAKMHGLEYQRCINNARINDLTGGLQQEVTSRNPIPFI